MFFFNQGMLLLGSNHVLSKRSINQIDSDDSPYNECAFTVVDGKQPMVQVNVGGVPNVALIVD